MSVTRTWTYLCSYDGSNIGITPKHTMVYAEFYHGLPGYKPRRQSLRGVWPQTAVKFCVYNGLGGDYSYSNMTNYFKMNNYCKFHGDTVIVMTAIMSDYYADFTHEIFPRLTNHNRGHSCVMLEFNS